ncbi:MerR family transcriptional regulator [Enterococcus sp. DIV0098]|uniref:helix-turn-helix domain-containing protein n=1 Tax=Enterococcus sp. DIV0098 TaxID=2774843 RepID=UPI003F683556
MIQPEKDTYNNYRQFRFADIYRLLVIDFYRKRGFTINEVKELQENFQEENFLQLMQQKSTEIEEQLQHYSGILERMNKLAAFHQRFMKQGAELTVARMPLFEILGSFNEFAEFDEYRQILTHCSKEEDILSAIIRSFEFTEDGITDSRMLIVKEVSDNQLQEGKEYLNFSQCLHTIMTENLDEENSEQIPQQMFEKISYYSQKRRLVPLGRAFVLTKMITYREQKEQAVLEIFVPIK